MNFLLKRKIHVLVGLSVLAILVAALAVSISRGGRMIFFTQGQSTVATSTDPFLKLALEAKSVYIVDLTNNKVLFQKNPDEVLPLASLTKLVSVLVAGENLPPETAVPITEGDDNGLDPGETWSLDKLIDFTLVTS